MLKPELIRISSLKPTCRLYRIAARSISVSVRAMGPSRQGLAALRASASVLLLSPKNQVLLLHRVQTSSAFPSAHVFPGGNLDPKQDGSIPEVDDPMRHEDGNVYRKAAIRECFEECGIILAKEAEAKGKLLKVNEQDREAARHLIHENKLNFEDWIQSQGGFMDSTNLVPFTRWITPGGLPKRFTTQMYLYFLPLQDDKEAHGMDTESLIPIPTSDGGLEHTTAKFFCVHEALRMAQAGEIVLYPPQFFLMHILARFISKDSNANDTTIQSQRDRIIEFAHSGVPPWTAKCISPIQVGKTTDGRAILSLAKPGPELVDSNRSGATDSVVLVDFQKSGPRRLDVADRKDVAAVAKAGGTKL